MRSNMSGVDRWVRVAIAAVLAYLVFTDVILGGWSIVALVVAGVFLVTAMVKFCPLYRPFKFSTKKA